MGTTYELMQVKRQHIFCFADFWNYIDMPYIILGYYNLYRQTYVGSLKFFSKLVMIIVISLALAKAFFFMKIFKGFSYIVTMMSRVMTDLQAFMVFFAILVVMLSIMLDVILMNNPDSNYQSVGPFAGNILSMLRISLGDFDFTELKGNRMTPADHLLIWMMWLVMVTFSLLIFLNFIIAEVSSSYGKVKGDIDALVQQERARLILEAEDVLTDEIKRNNKTKFPKYFIVREQQ